MLQNYENDVKNIKKELLCICKSVSDALRLSFDSIQNEDISALENLGLSIQKI